MNNIIKRRLRLEQKRAQVIMEEVKIKVQERKARTRRLIEMGGLVAKAKLDNLPTNSLFGALVSLQNELAEQSSIQDQWAKIGKNIFDQEEKDKSLSS